MDAANKSTVFTDDRCQDAVIQTVQSTEDDDNFVNGLIVRDTSDQTMWVIFRGTADIRDAIADAYISFTRFEFENLKGMCAHSGFITSVAEKMD
eukprot:CAMPEP_0116937686 /NCGR_PEP_ID=MMETSP0467-20121206/31649_1 /TAXON_ID=283647 /ORGANISM="Mesodinium pulex, Strain SPMC105" /LENGTH=93 /DNA_ID=CAMNT_0004619543 /DNA_START=679 /DNA_END=960 /DNA_ORIENTATION=-